MIGPRVKIAIVGSLFLLPIAFLTCVGTYHLWVNSWTFIAWWPMAACFLASYVLAWYWTRKRPLGTVTDSVFDTPDHWTARDHAAWKHVEQFAHEVPPVSQDQMSDLNRYAQDAQALAIRITQVYKPGSTDPFGHLTLPEILACGELIAHDMSKLVDQYIPGSHALTVNNFRSFRSAADWYQKGRNVYWAATLLLDPLRAGMQILATKAGLATTFQQVQKNMVAWFYATYLHELGRYLIELNSGRLRVGAKRYLELMAAHQAPPTTTTTDAPIDPANQVDPTRTTLAIVGPVKAGKSSLVNALLGEQLAAVAQVPLTAATTRYDLNEEGQPGLTLLDTVGFGLDGATQADVLAAVDVASKADILLLVVPARSAARQPEVDFLTRVRAAFVTHPELKLPPVIVVLTHIDLITPAMEWQPPYDWRAGMRPKEVAIRDAVAAAGEIFGKDTVAIVPVCTTSGQELGVRDQLLAAIATQLGDARGVSFLRTLHAEAAVDKTMKVIGQAMNVGRELWRALKGGTKK